jgi:peptidyl-prolyl cis-trans isomerase SurA
MIKITKLFLLFTLLFVFNFEADAYHDKIVAYVNDEIITSYDLERRIKLTEALNKTKVPPKSESQFLQALIDEKLLYQLAKRNDIKIPHMGLNEYANEISKNNGFSNIDELVKHYGVNKNELMKQIEGQFILRKLIMQQVEPDIKVSKQEILYNTKIISKNIDTDFKIDINSYVKIYEIVLYKGMIDQKDMIKTVNNLYSELQKGVSFESLAKQISQSQSATNGGLVGWVKLKDLSQPIVNTIEDGLMQEFKTGNVTSPIETKESIIVIKLADVRKTKVAPKALNEGDVKNILYNKKIVLSTRSFLSNLRKSSYVKIL